jgi:hypothetical protein
MNDRVKQLFDQAQQLSQEEQAQLLDMLLTKNFTQDRHWADEIERRVARLDRGETTLHDAGKVLAELRAKCV